MNENRRRRMVQALLNQKNQRALRPNQVLSAMDSEVPVDAIYRLLERSDDPSNPSTKSYETLLLEAFDLYVALQTLLLEAEDGGALDAAYSGLKRREQNDKAKKAREQAFLAVGGFLLNSDLDEEDSDV